MRVFCFGAGWGNLPRLSSRRRSIRTGHRLSPVRGRTGPAPAFDSPRIVPRTILIPHRRSLRSLGAGWGNRTPNYSLENCRFTTKLIPPSLATASFGGQAR